MDVSLEYIKMCDCHETQEQRGIKPDLPQETGIFYRNDDVWFQQRYVSPRDSSMKTWLPRQDQLQDMVLELFETNLYTIHTFFNEFIERYYTNNFYPCELFTSMEQLWLAFVMKEKFNKIWDGNEWMLKR